MIRNYLSGEPKQLLADLVSEFGAPHHPTFTHWSSGAVWIEDVSPLAEEELCQMTPETLAASLSDWHPPSERKFAPKRISHEGLAGTVARKVVLGNLEKYGNQLLLLAASDPRIAYALLTPFGHLKDDIQVPWDTIISLCEGLLAGRDAVALDIDRVQDVNWVSVRAEMARVLAVRSPADVGQCPCRCCPESETYCSNLPMTQIPIWPTAVGQLKAGSGTTIPRL